MNVPFLNGQGDKIPSVGIGTMTYPEPNRAVELISNALEIGYRHIDTARKYGTEEWVGEAIKYSNISRDDLWVTTKVTEDNAKEDDFARSVETSLNTMKLDYINLLLIHWPSRTTPLKETIGALVKAKRDGLAKNIGISNFTVSLIEHAVHLSDEPLFTNQIEYHAYINQDKVIETCHKYNLLITCHAPLARKELLNDPVLLRIAKKYKKSSAQIALKWLIQQPQIAIVPRALELSEVAENIDLFDFKLTENEMISINGLRANNMRIVDPEVRRPVWDI
tara:strand:- start:1558 stop:2394 length:837 start_codon:yes stop_codon:yes gene_type:complete